MRNSSIKFGAAFFVAVIASSCQSTQGVASRSEDDVIICRQFIAEVCITMEALKRDSFSPDELTFHQLAILTPSDPDFVQAEFMVLKKQWSFQKGGKQIVIVCAQPQIHNGTRKYFAAFSSGEYRWISAEEFDMLQLRDYRALPKIR